MNKTVLVTGAARGIGYSISKELLLADFFVIGVSLSGKFGDLTSFEKFQGIQCDLGDVLACEEKLKPILESENCPEVLINNAGIAEPCSFSVSDETWKLHWDKTMQVNLLTPTRLVKWAIPMWQKKKNGIHIAIASRASYRGETEQYASYAASKSGLVGVSKTIARGFGKDGIVSMVIAPGFTMTDMAKEAIPIYGEEYMKKDNVLGKIPEPEEIAHICVLLASGKVKHLTGSTIHLNSGSYML